MSYNELTRARMGRPSLATLAAMRRASSRVSSLGSRAASRFLLEIDVGERLPFAIAHLFVATGGGHVYVLAP